LKVNGDFLMILTKITSKKLAKKFLADIFEQEGTFTFVDDSLSLKGKTQLSFNNYGNLVAFSFGENWRDQKVSVIGEAISWVYNNRKSINAEIKRQSMNW